MQPNDDARTFLEEECFSALTMLNANGSLQPVVMWYEPQGDAILMNTKRGRGEE